MIKGCGLTFCAVSASRSRILFSGAFLVTLIVSLRIPDGIVLAGDSISTMMSSNEVTGDVDVTCPSCGHQHITTAKLQGAALPATTLSYAQKVFPFLGKFGIGTAGTGQLTGKTIYFAMRELENEVLSKEEGERPANVSQVARIVGDRAFQLLQEDVHRLGVDINTLPDDWEAISFQVVGYESEVATTEIISIGKQVRIVPFQGPGCTVIGRREVVNALWGLTPNPEDLPMYNAFSLQDAMAYAEFLINATASHQQFLRTIATVGGEVDIALITPFDNFKWIRQKALYAKISEAKNA